MQESYVWLLCGCTLAFGRLHDLCRPNFARREQVRVKARTRDTASGGSRARHAPAQRRPWEGCSSLWARSGCTLRTLRQDFHRPRRENILNRTITQSYDQRPSAREATAWACQLLAAADRVPFAGAALPRLVLRSVTCQWCRQVKARGRLSSRTLGGEPPNVRRDKQRSRHERTLVVVAAACWQQRTCCARAHAVEYTFAREPPGAFSVPRKALTRVSLLG